MTRPNVAERSSVVLPTTRDTAMWFEFYGYTTTIAELARIFDVGVHTLRARVKAGWPIESALIADPSDGWKITNVHLLQQQNWVVPAVIAKMTYAFDPKRGRNNGT